MFNMTGIFSLRGFRWSAWIFGYLRYSSHSTWLAVAAHAFFNLAVMGSDGAVCWLTSSPPYETIAIAIGMVTVAKIVCSVEDLYQSEAHRPPSAWPVHSRWTPRGQPRRLPRRRDWNQQLQISTPARPRSQASAPA